MRERSVVAGREDVTPLSLVLLAAPRCTVCAGWGQVGTRCGSRPCNCVYRGIWARIALASSRLSRRLEAGGRNSPTFTELDYLADVALLVRRTLADEPDLADIFQAHHRRGLSIEQLARRSGLTTYQVQGRLHRTEALLGRAAYHMQPYALFPLHRYICRGRDT